MVSDSERHIRNMENLTKTHMFGLLIGFSEAESPRGGVVRRQPPLPPSSFDVIR